MRALLICVVLSACGAGGAPFKPAVSGTVGVGTSGVTTSGNVEASNGTLTIGMGF